MEISKVSQMGQTTYTNTSTAVDNSNNQSQSVAMPIQNANVSTNQNSGQDTTTNQKDKPVNEKELRKAVDRLNKFVEADNIEVEYDVHPQFKDIMIKIVDKSTGNVITEVPPKKILDMVAKMCELAGVIFDKKA